MTCKGTSKNNSCIITQCCVELRAIAIFEILGAFDRQFLSERATANFRAVAIVTQKNLAPKEAQLDQEEPVMEPVPQPRITRLDLNLRRLRQKTKSMTLLRVGRRW